MSNSLKAFFLLLLVLLLSLFVPQCIDSVKAGVYKEMIHYADKSNSDVEPMIVCEWIMERSFPLAEGTSIEYKKQVHWIVAVAEPPREISKYNGVKMVIILLFCYEDKAELEGYSVAGFDGTIKGYRQNKDTGSYEAYDFDKMEFVEKKTKI